ncbi:MAG: hypothetical protein ACR2MT_16300 [Aurantibacter sp.]
MRVLNVHFRVLNQSKEQIEQLFSTLATKEDKIWPFEKWPAIRFKTGLRVGAEGGHGPIRYKVINYYPKGMVEFVFQKPKGFNGTHKLEIVNGSDQSPALKHTIEMNTTGMGSLTWLLAVQWLHDALIEDAFDKVENLSLTEKKRTEWNLWVKILRKVLN